MALDRLQVAIVEDQREVREGLGALINGTSGFSCVDGYRTMEDVLEGQDRRRGAAHL
jgi:hypothetical protein